MGPKKLLTCAMGLAATIALLAAPLSANAAAPSVSADAKNFSVRVQSGYDWNTVNVAATNDKPVLLS